MGLGWRLEDMENWGYAGPTVVWGWAGGWKTWRTEDTRGRLSAGAGLEAGRPGGLRVRGADCRLGLGWRLEDLEDWGYAGPTVGWGWAGGWKTWRTEGTRGRLLAGAGLEAGRPGGLRIRGADCRLGLGWRLEDLRDWGYAGPTVGWGWAGGWRTEGTRGRLSAGAGLEAGRPAGLRVRGADCRLGLGWRLEDLEDWGFAGRLSAGAGLEVGRPGGLRVRGADCRLGLGWRLEDLEDWGYAGPTVGWGWAGGWKTWRTEGTRGRLSAGAGLEAGRPGGLRVRGADCRLGLGWRLEDLEDWGYAGPTVGWGWARGWKTWRTEGTRGRLSSGAGLEAGRPGGLRVRGADCRLGLGWRLEDLRDWGYAGPTVVWGWAGGWKTCGTEGTRGWLSAGAGLEAGRPGGLRVRGADCRLGLGWRLEDLEDWGYAGPTVGWGWAGGWKTCGTEGTRGRLSAGAGLEAGRPGGLRVRGADCRLGLGWRLEDLRDWGYAGLTVGWGWAGGWKTWRTEGTRGRLSAGAGLEAGRPGGLRVRGADCRLGLGWRLEDLRDWGYAGPTVGWGWAGGWKTWRTEGTLGRLSAGAGLEAGRPGGLRVRGADCRLGLGWRLEDLEDWGYAGPTVGWGGLEAGRPAGLRVRGADCRLGLGWRLEDLEDWGYAGPTVVWGWAGGWKTWRTEGTWGRLSAGAGLEVGRPAGLRVRGADCRLGWAGGWKTCGTEGTRGHLALHSFPYCTFTLYYAFNGHVVILSTRLCRRFRLSYRLSNRSHRLVTGVHVLMIELLDIRVSSPSHVNVYVKICGFLILWVPIIKRLVEVMVDSNSN